MTKKAPLFEAFFLSYFTLKRKTNMKQLVKAVLAVMDDCKGIEKSMTVGSGNNSYKGVSDKDVKIKVGQSMHKHGLIILPTDVQATTTINNWEEETQYGKKSKQSAFVEVVTKYTLLHESGESIQLVGYGHGTDPQDKAAGKATTYALKYTLLYSFLVATGHIDDTDNTHSDDLPVAPKAKATPPPPATPTEVMSPESNRWAGAVKALSTNATTIMVIEEKFIISPEHRAQILKEATEMALANKQPQA